MTGLSDKTLVFTVRYSTQKSCELKYMCRERIEKNNWVRTNRNLENMIIAIQMRSACT